MKPSQKDDLVDPDGGGPGLQLVKPYLFDSREACLPHFRLKSEPGIVRQQNLATVGRVSHLYGNLEAWPAEHSVLCQQV